MQANEAHVSPPSLTDPKMCVDGGIARCARQVLVLPVRNVLVCAGITVLLGQPKVNDVHQVAFLAESHQEVVRLYISMDEVLGMDVLNATYLERKGGRVVKQC